MKIFVTRTVYDACTFLNMFQLNHITVYVIYRSCGRTKLVPRRTSEATYVSDYLRTSCILFDLQRVPEVAVLSTDVMHIAQRSFAPIGNDDCGTILSRIRGPSYVNEL